MTLDDIDQLIRACEFDTARTAATNLFMADRNNLIALRMVAFCDFRLQNYQGFFAKYLAILRRTPNATTLVEFACLLNEGLLNRVINLDQRTTEGVMDVMSDAVNRSLLDGTESHTRDYMAAALSHLCYLLDELTPAIITPLATAVHTVVRQTSPQGILAATSPKSARFVAYPLAAIGLYDEAFEIASVSTTPIEFEDAQPAVAAADRPDGSEGANTPECYDASHALRRGGERAVKGTVPDGALGDVLDLGCGTGIAGRLLHGRAARITGVDIDAQRLEHTRKQGHYAELVQADAITFLESGDSRFDIVVSVMVISMIADLRRLVRAVAKRLRPGGAFCFDLLLCGPGAPLRGTSWSEFVRPVSEVRTAAQEAGLAVEQEIFGPQEWGVGGFYRLRAA